MKGLSQAAAGRAAAHEMEKTRKLRVFSPKVSEINGPSCRLIHGDAQGLQKAHVVGADLQVRRRPVALIERGWV
jgi:hypothetical protein